MTTLTATAISLTPKSTTPMTSTTQEKGSYHGRFLEDLLHRPARLRPLGYHVINVVMLLFSFVVYTLNRFWWKHVTTNWFLHGYLNDVLGGLSYIAILDLCAGYLGKRLTPLGVSLFIGIACLIWEGLWPLLDSKSVADLGDVLCYIIGADLYITIRSIFKKEVSS